MNLPCTICCFELKVLPFAKLCGNHSVLTIMGILPTWREDGRRAARDRLLTLPGKLRDLPDENPIVGGGLHVADLLLHLSHGQVFEPDAPLQLPDLLGGTQVQVRNTLALGPGSPWGCSSVRNYTPCCSGFLFSPGPAGAGGCRLQLSQILSPPLG